MALKGVFKPPKVGPPALGHAMLTSESVNSMATPRLLASQPCQEMRSSVSWRVVPPAGQDDDKQFGFIDCPEIQDYFWRDVYVSKDRPPQPHVVGSS